MIRRGQTVTFLPHRLSHTVTIGPPDYTTEIARDWITSRGVWNPFTFRPSEPFQTRQPITFDGRNHGNGFLASGIFPLPGIGGTTYRVRFTQPGTYRYLDVWLPSMEGVIVVR